MGKLADLLCKFGRTVSLLPVLTQNCPKNFPKRVFCVEIFGHLSFSRSVLPLKRGDFQVGKGGGGSLKAKTMRRRRENKRECGEEERVPNELLADEGRSS